jgi:peptide deformylase
VLINPEIVKVEGNIEEDYEGCLSVPSIYGMVPRHNKIRLKTQLLDGSEVRMKLGGMDAKTLQHEIDHLNGVLFIDHIKDKKDAFYELDKDGELKPLDYDKVKQNNILWQ